MNEKFFAIAKEKQDRIVNAALKAFSQNDYKHTNTNDIAAMADISKGLLFYYFGSKKGLYVYLYQYSIKFITERTRIQEVEAETDFFDLILQVQRIKIEIMKAYPYIFSFILKAYYEQDETVASHIAEINVQSNDSSTEIILRNADRSKFREDVTLEMAFNMFYWCSEGFMKAKMLSGHLDVDEINDEFTACLQLLKRSFYKEEYV